MRISDGVLLATVFVTGACVLVIEIAGTRILAPFFGSGIYTWSALISITLAALALGYWLGGRVADARPDTRLLYGLCLAAGCWTLLTPSIARLVLPGLAQTSDLRLGVAGAGLLLFFPNLCLLGTIGPFAIRLITRLQSRVGTSSGLVFAVSTVGSLLAAVGTGFFLIPNFGSRAILTGTGAVLVALALAGNRRPRFLAVAVLVLAVVAAVTALGNKPRSSVASIEVLDYAPSFYGDLHVIRNGAYLALLADGIGQNYAHTEGRWIVPYVSFLASVPGIDGRAPAGSRKGLVIGLGAGQLPMLLERAGMDTDAVEIDPKVGMLAERHFGFKLAKGTVHYLDGRQFLARSRESYDYIVLDAFSGEQVAWHLTSREALAEARARLRPGGLLAVNLAAMAGGEDVAALQRTLQSVFPFVRTFSEGKSGQLDSFEFLASLEPIALDESALRDQPGQQQAVRHFTAHELSDLSGTLVLTDDFNPINDLRRQVHLLWRAEMRAWAGGDGLEWLLY